MAIAISLVPPLAVVGITLESGEPSQALGALLLFGTNVAAIIATGTVVLLAFDVREVANDSGFEVGLLTGRTLAVIGLMVVLVAVPLTIGSVNAYQQQSVVSTATPIAERWAEAEGGRSRVWATSTASSRSPPLVRLRPSRRRRCAQTSTRPALMT